MSYPPPPYGPPAGQQQPPMYNYNPNQPPMYQQQNPNMMYQHHQPMLGHWQAPQYAYSQPPNTTFSFSFGNAAPPQYAAPPNPIYGPQQHQQPAAPPYPQQMYPNMPTQAAPPNYGPIYPTQSMPQQPGYAEHARSPAFAARSDSAALPDNGRAFAQRNPDTIQRRPPVVCPQMCQEVPYIVDADLSPACRLTASLLIAGYGQESNMSCERIIAGSLKPRMNSVQDSQGGPILPLSLRSCTASPCGSIEKDWSEQINWGADIRTQQIGKHSLRMAQKKSRENGWSGMASTSAAWSARP
ncbi:hypothetical protein D0859_07693 [Hortaea werneckii]|uniref:Uncharacterized protein n=1 Tax=Hortaea werneckii TaxID=91943 RepID=A0A3M7IRT4_HORWE|nr:hypothetical protein D0859_07693 [Hortaea werneckii]